MIEGTWMAYISLYPYLKSTGNIETIISKPPLKR
jgi:hypothetical protein